MAVCFERDREATQKFLTGRLHDDDTTPRLRFDIAWFLVHHKIEDPGILFGLANGHGITIHERTQVLTRHSRSRPQEAAALVDAVLREVSSCSPFMADVINDLLQLAPDKTMETLVAMTKNADLGEGNRFAAAARLPIRERLEAYEYLTSISAFGERRRMDTAAEAFRLNASAGLRIYERIITTAADDAAKARLAIWARKVVGSSADQLVEALADDTNLSFDVHMTLVRHLDRHHAVRLLHRLARTGPTHQRMNAAKRMVSVGGAREAATAYQEIADSSGMSRKAREHAQAEADRLSGA